jgi:DNA-directed RNA polymerase specialized sigma24 family protein
LSNEDGFAPASPEPEKPAVVDHDLLAPTLERESARVFEYCRALIGRALIGREDVAVSATAAALDSARSMLRDPDRLRAWLVDLALRQAPPAEPVADPAPDQGVLRPDGREAFELVYRHGIHREDLGAVLGVPAGEASALLAAAELELGRPEPLAEPDPAEPDPAEAAPGAAGLISGQSLLPDADRLRAWLFALARQEAVAAVSSGSTGQAAPAAELTRYTGSYPAATDAQQPFPPASWWQDTVTQPTPRRRRRIAALAAIPLAAAAGVAVYLGVVSHPASSGAGTGPGGSARSSAPPRSARPNAGLAAAAPHASASPTIPISALLPVSPVPVLLPPSVPPAPPPTTKPSPTPTPKPSTKPSPTPTPKPSTKPSPTPTPTVKSPSPTAKPSPSPTKSAG